MATELRPTGISVVGAMPWGTHFCHFYATKADLLDILIPYFKAGLEHNEFCMWVIFDPLDEAEAINALRAAIPTIDEYIASGQIAIVPHAQWYIKENTFDLQQVISGWQEKLAQALASGYDGMRVNGNEAWLTKDDWKEFAEYEDRLNAMIANQRMIVLCTYPIAVSSGANIFDVARTHQFAVVKRDGDWEMVETPDLIHAKAEITQLNQHLEQRVAERTGELETINDALRQEIAERTRVEANLRTQQEILQQILDHIPVMINFVGADGRLKLVNRAWEHTLGWTLEEIAAHNLDIFVELYPDPQERQVVQQFIAEAQGVWADFKPRLRDGRLLDTAWVVIQLSDGSSMGVGQDITERKRAEAERARLFAQVDASREQLQILSRQLLLAQEAERHALARELHDEIGQRLTGLSLILAAKPHLPPDLAQVRLAEAESLVRDLIEQVRNLALDLRPGILDDLGLVPALVWMFERYITQTHVAVRFEHRVHEQRFALEVETTAYRIVQEALTNVARHADVAEATVRLWTDGDTLSVIIADQGRGFEPQAARTSASIGLVGMAERVALLGGELTIESAPGAGTRVTAVVPLTKGSESPTQEHRA